MQKEQNSNDSLSPEEENILKQMEDFFNSDVKNMITGGCNVSCATILGICIEVYGGIADGTLYKTDKNGKYSGEEGRFKTFIELMSEGMKSEGYASLDDKLQRNNKKGLYNIFRSTLVHGYFFGQIKIRNDPKKPDLRCCPDNIGIQLSKENLNQIEIHTNDLADDIKTTRDKLFEKIRTGEDGSRQKFRKALDNIRKIHPGGLTNISGNIVSYQGRL